MFATRKDLNTENKRTASLLPAYLNTLELRPYTTPLLSNELRFSHWKAFGIQTLLSALLLIARKLFFLSARIRAKACALNLCLKAWQTEPFYPNIPLPQSLDRHFRESYWKIKPNRAAHPGQHSGSAFFLLHSNTPKYENMELTHQAHSRKDEGFKRLKDLQEEP